MRRGEASALWVYSAITPQLSHILGLSFFKIDKLIGDKEI